MLSFTTLFASSYKYRIILAKSKDKNSLLQFVSLPYSFSALRFHLNRKMKKWIEHEL